MDITKCEDSLCPSKKYCYRFTAPNSEAQIFHNFHREDDAYNCDLFWDNGICKYCNLQNGAHRMGCERNIKNITL